MDEKCKLEMKFEVEFILNHNDLISEDAQPARCAKQKRVEKRSNVSCGCEAYKQKLTFFNDDAC